MKGDTMYEKVADKVAELGFGMLVQGMDKGQALKLIQEADPKDIQEALKQHARELKSGKSAYEAIRTAAVPSALKSLLMALMLLAPAAMASPGATEEFSLKLKRAPVTMETIEQAEQKAESIAKQDIKKDIASIKDSIKTMKPGQPASGTYTIGGKHYSIQNAGQGSVIQEIVQLDNKMKALVSAGAMTTQEHTTTIGNLLVMAGIPSK